MAEASSELHSGAASQTRSRFVLLPVILAIALLAVWLAARKAWLCDDAFISFRYAENLIEGKGLVFNEGERVEGYTNFMWTVWVALGMAMGVGPESWSIAGGLACYAGSILTLGVAHLHWRRRLGRTELTLPIAAILAVVHDDWGTYATGGLETSCVTFLSLAGTLVVVNSPATPRRSIAAGLLLALAALARPDAILFAALAGAFVWWQSLRGTRSLILYALGFLALWLPHFIWRVWYYDDWLPNTFYAKSAGMSWYTQGFTYARLYFAKYGALLLCLPLIVMSEWKTRRQAGSQRDDVRELSSQCALFVVMGLVYSLYVVRVGGDFMFARLFIPAAPFLCMGIDLGLLLVCSGAHRRWYRPAALAIILATVVAPYPISGTDEIDGIVREENYYPPEETSEVRLKAEELRPFFDRLPVCVAFYGSEARLVFYSKPAVAIECNAGLTDRVIARQPLERRGRIGHEKKPTLNYLIGDRRAHFLFHPRLDETLNLDAAIPRCGILFGDRAARVLHWDQQLMAELADRGARFEPFTDFLDRLIAGLPDIPIEEARDAYEKCLRFYFDYVDDSGRKMAFLHIIGAKNAGEQ